MKKNKAIFFDRDDTLIVDKNYMYKKDDLEFFPDTFTVLKELQAKGFLLFIVTNQSGIGRGFFKESDMHSFHEYMLEKLKEAGITISKIAFCPHAPEDMCHCRKPSPKLINQLCEEFNIDKKLSYMVGDKQSDLDAGTNAGLQSLNVKKSTLTKELKNLN